MLLVSPEEARAKTLVGKSKGNLISHRALQAGGQQQGTHLPAYVQGRLHLHKLACTTH